MSCQTKAELEIGAAIYQIAGAVTSKVEVEVNQ